MRWISVFLAVFVALALAGCAAAPKPTSEQVSRQGIWMFEQDAEACFVATYAFATDNSARQEPDAFLYITTFRDGKQWEQPSIRFKRDIPQASIVSIRVAGKRFVSFVNLDRRDFWLNTRYEELDLIDLMQRAETVTVGIESSREEASLLRFSTEGFGEALRSLKNTCPSPTA